MKMRAIAALVAILALGVGSMPALAGPNGGQDQFACIGDVPSTNPANTDFGRCAGPVRSQFGGVILDIGIHVYARLSGLTAGGITTAEFYVRGWEQIAAMGYTVADSYSPVANVVNGSMVRPTGALLDIRRVNIAFPSCQPDPLIGGTFVFLGAATGQVIGG